MRSQLITINAGSSSIKFALFAAGGSLQRLTEGQIERIGSPAASITVIREHGEEMPEVRNWEWRGGQRRVRSKALGRASRNKTIPIT